MLVLSREIGTTIRIGDNIDVTILAVNGGVVRVGIDADKSIPVHRLEVYDKIQEEKTKPKHVRIYLKILRWIKKYVY